MRATLNAILAFIGATSLTDEEWESLELSEDPSERDQFNALKYILVQREAVSDMYRRLVSYFKAKGMSFGDESSSAAIGSSNIFVGSPL